MSVTPAAARETDSLLPNQPRLTNNNNNNNASMPKLLLSVCIAIGMMIIVGIAGYALGQSSNSGSLSLQDAAAERAGFQLDDDDNDESIIIYDATQFISFTINTLGGRADAGECDDGELPVDPASNTCYLGNTHNLTQDLHHRLEIMQAVLHKLHAAMLEEDSEVDANPRVLKIFSMPEFFLRGPHGAYSSLELIDRDGTEDDGLLIQVGDAIRNMIEKDVFQHFLFIFGTVLVAESLEFPDRPFYEVDHHHDDAEQLLYSNFAPIAKGGTGHHHHYLLQKHYISGADFLSAQNNNNNTTTLPNPTQANLHDYADADDLKYLMSTLRMRNITLVDDNIIQFDGIRMGIEICLDHRMGALWHTLQESNGDLVDVLVVTSAGMAIERGPNPVVSNGGVVYLCDGEASSAACWHNSKEEFNPDTTCRVPGPGDLGHLPFGGPGYTEFVSLAGCIDVEDLDLEGYYSLHQPQGCANTLKMYGIDVMDEFAYYPPSLEVYPTIKLPRRPFAHR